MAKATVFSAGLSQVLQPDHCHSHPYLHCSPKPPQQEESLSQRLPTARLSPSSPPLHLPPRGPHVGVPSLPSLPLPPPVVSALPWLPVLSLLGPISVSLWSALPLTSELKGLPAGNQLVPWQSSQSLLLTLQAAVDSIFLNL